MTFAAPWALILVAPWLAAAAWVLLASREVAYVPFTRLWPKSETAVAARRSPKRPPLWVVLLLTAALLAIFAAAGLSVDGGSRSLTVIVDCGLSMSPKLRIAVAAAGLHLTAADTMSVIPVPGEPFSCRGWLETSSLQFTAADTSAALDRAIRAALANRSGQIAVVTDRMPPIADPRLIWLRPSDELEDAGIDRLAVTELAGGAGQAMVTVFNGTPQTHAALRVDLIEQPIDLPPRGQTRDYFVDLPKVGDIVEARLLLPDAIVADNTAYLVRSAAWPKIEAAAALPAAVGRVLDVYRTQRPGSEQSMQALISAAPMGENMAGVWIAGAAATSFISSSTLAVAEHPVTAAIDWKAIVKSLRGQALPQGWRSVVQSGEVALVAVRDAPARQVWIGFDTTAIADRPDFVVLWTNIFDWLGGGRPQFTSEPASMSAAPRTAIRQADAAIIASPGVYQLTNGSRIALSCPTPRRSDGGQQSAALKTNPAPAVRSLSELLLSAALLFIAAALSLHRRRLT